MRNPDVGPWALVPGWVISRLRGVKYAREALSLYCEIALRAERETQSWRASRTDLGDALGVSADTVSRWSKVLVDLGALEVEANYTADGDRGWNTYRVFVADPLVRGEVPAHIAPPLGTSDVEEQEPLDKNPGTPRRRGGRGPRPETTARQAEAQALVRAWWDWHQQGHDGRAPTAVPYVGVVGIVEKLLAAGYSTKEVKHGLIEAQRTSTVSVGAVEIAIKRVSGSAPQARMVRDDDAPESTPRSGWEREHA